VNRIIGAERSQVHNSHFPYFHVYLSNGLIFSLMQLTCIYFCFFSFWFFHMCSQVLGRIYIITYYLYSINNRSIIFSGEIINSDGFNYMVIRALDDLF